MNSRAIKLTLCALGFLSMPVYPLDFRNVAATAAKVAANLGLVYAGTYALIYAHELGHALTFKAYTGKQPLEMVIKPITFTSTSTKTTIKLFSGYCVFDSQTHNALRSDQRANVYINGPLLGLIACLGSLLGTTFVMKFINSASLWSALKASVNTLLINNTQPLGIQIATVIAVHLNLQALNPLIPGSDGSGIFNEFNATDKTKKISSHVINTIRFVSLALMGWATYKAYITR